MTVDNRSIKNYVIDLLEISELNLLNQLYNLKPEEVRKQIQPDINHIEWIFGHCASHLDNVLGELCQGKKAMSQEMSRRYAYNVPKTEAIDKPLISFRELVDKYLEISKNAFAYLNELPEEKFRDLPEKNNQEKNNESVITCIKRIALHYLGHTGHINLIRRQLGNPGSGFVAGMNKASRQKRKEEWLSWWNQEKKNFE